MGAVIGSKNLPTEVWSHQNGTFQVVLGIALGQMADPTKVPTILGDMQDQIGDILHQAWPDRFPPGERGPLLVMMLTDYPQGEQEEFARAVRAAGAGLRNGNLAGAARALYSQDHAADLAKAADELADFCDRSIAAGAVRIPDID